MGACGRVVVSTASTFRELFELLVERRLIGRNVEQLLALEALLRVAHGERWAPAAVVAAVTSLLATTPDAWDAIEAEVERFFAGQAPQAQGPGRVQTTGQLPPNAHISLQPPPPVAPAVVQPTTWERSLDWTLKRIRRVSALGVTLVLVMGVVGVSALGGLLVEQTTNLVEVPAAPGPDDPTPGSVAEPDTSVSIRSDGSTRRLVPDGVQAERWELPASYVAPLGLFVLSIILASFGVFLWRLPGVYRTEVTKRRQDALVGRKGVGREGGRPYRVECFPPFAESAMDDVATLLGRIGTEARGTDLDVKKTLDATIRSNGPSPVLRGRHTAREILVFVDIESGDHPYLHGVEWVLARWRRGGVRLVRYDFGYRPQYLIRREERPSDLANYRAGMIVEHEGPGSDEVSIEIEALARQTQGMPLFVFSRGDALAHEYTAGGLKDAPWSRVTAAWPKRVFVDLDPRGYDERNYHEKELLETMREHGFLCVPFGPAGLEAAAQHLAGRGGGPPPEPTPLRPLEEVHDAVERWLATVAMVPDPTWVQLEAFRRQFLAQELPDPRYVERALEWVHKKFRAQGRKVDGTKFGSRLDLDIFANQLHIDWWQKDPELVEGAIKFLKIQMEGAKVDTSDPANLLWLLKYKFLQVMLEPARAGELLAEFPGSCVDDELLKKLAKAEAREQAWKRAGRRFEPLAASVRSLHGNRVPAGRLKNWLRSLTWKAWMLSVACGGMALLIMHSVVHRDIEDTLVGAVPADLEVLLATDAEACDFSGPPKRPAKPNPDIQAPPTGRSCGVVETALANTDAPMNLIGLTGGAFTMGSPESESGRSEDEGPQHRVALSRFAVCETEVSVRQYELVTGEKPKFCADGCDNDHPVQLVSWEDSVKFLNALTRLENKRQGSGEQLTECYDEQTWAWEAGCTGYRLPTEAEWEYAARAGSTTAFHFGDDETKICDYANIRDVSFPDDDELERANCDDGFKNLAPVQTERLKPNAWGLHGVHGNVWEWVYDWYDSSFYEKSQSKDENPANKNTADGRVLRGGSFVFLPSDARSASRDWLAPELRDRLRGLRCVRGPSPPSH